jgi:hypothetical protein
LSCCSAGENRQSTYNERQDTVANSSFVNAVASHRLDDGPVLPKQSRRFLYVQGVDFDTTRPPSTIVRYLKEERVANRFPVAAHQHSFFSHSVPPLICVEPEQNAFSILISVRRDCDARRFVPSVANIRHVGTWLAAGKSLRRTGNENMGNELHAPVAGNSSGERVKRDALQNCFDMTDK